MLFKHNGGLGILLAGSICLAIAAPAHATLVANGITYSLLESASANPQVDEFTLDISGINGITDTEGGRKGVTALAFTLPSGFLGAVSPIGFSETSGGLAANGCNGHGNFFCFSAASNSSALLPANSALTFNFSVAATDFSNYAPDFKIEWSGTRKHYNLVSEPLTPMISATGGSGSVGPGVPEPDAAPLLAVALLASGILGVFRRTARKS